MEKENVEFYKIPLDFDTKNIDNTIGKKKPYITTKLQDLNKISKSHKTNNDFSMNFSDSYENKKNSYKSTLNNDRIKSMMGNKAISFMSEVD